MEEDVNGTFLTIADQRIPAEIVGSTVRAGIGPRVGYCAAWAVVAIERLLRDHPENRPVLVFGRSAGVAQQTWVTFTGEGRQWALDLTLSEQAMPLDRYLAGIHGKAGTSIPIPDERRLRALHEAIAAGLWNARDQFIAAVQ